jgi:hypothetical protein
VTSGVTGATAVTGATTVTGVTGAKRYGNHGAWLLMRLMLRPTHYM